MFVSKIDVIMSRSDSVHSAAHVHKFLPQPEGRARHLAGRVGVLVEQDVLDPFDLVVERLDRREVPRRRSLRAGRG
jgi:hypothetical protein